MNKEYIQLFTCYGKMGSGKSYMEHLKEKDKEIERLNNIINKLQNQLQQKENIIKEVREYIENNDLYEQDYDYDYEENLVVGPPSDETARKILLKILDKVEECGDK